MSNASNLMACRECDALQRLPRLKEGEKARCCACGALLYRRPRGGLDWPLAFFLGAWAFYVLANAFPLVSLDINGRSSTTTLIGTAWALYQHDMAFLAVLVFFTSTAAPAWILGSTLYVLLALHFRRRLPGVRGILWFISRLHPWEMADVFVLSILVAMVKLAGEAEVVLGAGLYALMATIVLALLGGSHLDMTQLWEKWSQLFERRGRCE